MPLDISAKESNFNIVQGDSFSLQIMYKDSSGSAINLNGYGALMEVRDKPGGRILCATASVGDGITITSASAGQIDILLSAEKTANFTVPKAAYQLKLVSSSTTSTILYGWFIVEKSVVEGLAIAPSPGIIYPASVQYSVRSASSTYSSSVTSPAGVPTRYYGSFYDTTIQTSSVINTGVPVRFNTSDSASNSGVRMNTSSILMDHAGIYNFQFSAQIDTSTSSDIEFWLRKNGNDVPWTNTKVSTSNQNKKAVAAWNFISSANSNDCFQLIWSTNNTGTHIDAASATAYSPAIPSVILTVTQV